MVFIQFQDEGKPFNPLDVTLPNLDAGMESRNAAGLGIFLIIKVMDRTEYHYSVDGGNCLTLVKNVSDSRGRET